MRFLLLSLSLTVIVACATNPPLWWVPAYSMAQLEPDTQSIKLPATFQVSLAVPRAMDKISIAPNSKYTKSPKFMFDPNQVFSAIANLVNRRDGSKINQEYFLVTSITIEDYELYPDFLHSAPFFGIMISIAKENVENHIKNMRYYVEFMAPNFRLHNEYDTKTQQEISRAANTTMYYGIAYGVLDLSQCVDCASGKIVYYKKFQNGSWVRVKRLAQRN